MKGIKDEMKRIKLSIKYWEDQKTPLINRLSIIQDHLVVLNGKKQRHNEHYNQEDD